jgi:Putative Actinobacterial Holin-X, holin superfamily III
LRQALLSLKNNFMETEQLKEKAEDLTEHLGDLAETSYKLAIINLTQKATNAASQGLTIIVLCTLGMFILFFGGFGLAWWLGDVIDSRAGGFAIVAGFFLLLTLCILAVRKKIVFPYIRNLIIRKVYD